MMYKNQCRYTIIHFFYTHWFHTWTEHRSACLIIVRFVRGCVRVNFVSCSCHSEFWWELVLPRVMRNFRFLGWWARQEYTLWKQVIFWRLRVTWQFTLSVDRFCFTSGLSFASNGGRYNFQRSVFLPGFELEVKIQIRVNSRVSDSENWFMWRLLLFASQWSENKGKKHKL